MLKQCSQDPAVIYESLLLYTILRLTDDTFAINFNYQLLICATY